MPWPSVPRSVTSNVPLDRKVCTRYSLPSTAMVVSTPPLALMGAKRTAVCADEGNRK